MSIAYKISAYNRRRKWRIFMEEIRPKPGMGVLDVGYSDDEHSATDNYIEKHYPYPHMLTALGIEEPRKFRLRYPHVNTIRYDGRTIPFDDMSFDVCWSNAVVEHVGNRDRQLTFIKEIKRVAKTAFITTPNAHFPIEVHTRTPLLHFLPTPYFEKYLHLIGKKWATGDYMNLLSLRSIKSLLGDANISRFKIIENRLLGFTLDYVIIFKA